VHLEDTIRPAIESWAASKSKVEASDELAAAGIAAGPSNTALDVINDPHVATRNMLVELPRIDGVEEPVLIPGNPIKMSRVAEGPEHTAAVLQEELGLDDADLASLRADGVIN
jgi:crotonobetainyl-CoA:carnitine CoA-transferase CaiB-like acyl-CoA transferase